MKDDETGGRSAELATRDGVVEDVLGSTSQGVEEVAPPRDLRLPRALHDHVEEVGKLLNEGRHLGQQGVYSEAKRAGLMVRNTERLPS